MEVLVTVLEVGAYSERQYQRQDGTTEYFKSRGFVLKRGWRYHLWRIDGRGCIEEPRYAVLSEPALYCEGFLEAACLGR